MVSRFERLTIHFFGKKYKSAFDHSKLPNPKLVEAAHECASRNFIELLALVELELFVLELALLAVLEPVRLVVSPVECHVVRTLNSKNVKIFLYIKLTPIILLVNSAATSRIAPGLGVLSSTFAARVASSASICSLEAE